MYSILSFGLGVILLGVYFWMLSDRISKRIRNSQYWFIGWLGALLILSMGAKLVMPILNGLPINDDVAIPVMFVTIFFVTGVMYLVKMYQLRRQIKQG